MAGHLVANIYAVKNGRQACLASYTRSNIHAASLTFSFLGVNLMPKTCSRFPRPGMASTSLLLHAARPVLATPAGSANCHLCALESPSPDRFWIPLAVGHGHRQVTLTPVPRSSWASDSERLRT